MEISHLAVAYRDAEDDELLRTGCRLARELRGSRLSVIHIIEVPMSYPIDAADAPGLAEAERVVEHCDEIGQEFNLATNTETLAARDAGPALVEHTKNMGVDLLLIGAGDRAIAGGPALQNTPEFVLLNAHCAVLVGRLRARGPVG